MWSQQWNNIYDIVEPYRGKIAIDITPKLQQMVRFIVQVIDILNQHCTQESDYSILFHSYINNNATISCS